jgi:hypothetical protein
MFSPPGEFPALLIPNPNLWKKGFAGSARNNYSRRIVAVVLQSAGGGGDMCRLGGAGGVGDDMDGETARTRSRGGGGDMPRPWVPSARGPVTGTLS